MTGLLHGQLIDYLIVGLVCTVAGGIVLEAVKHKVSTFWRRIIFALVFATVGVVGHFVFIREPKDEVTSSRPNGQDSPTPPRTGPEGSPSRATSPTQPNETSEEGFVREHIAPPNKRI